MPNRKKFRKDVTVGRGKRVTLSADTKSELNRKVDQLKADIISGKAVRRQATTVSNLADTWLTFHSQQNEIMDSTRLSYAGLIRKHINPLFGTYRVQELTEEMISERLARRGHKSSSTRRKMFLTLHMMLKYAKRTGIIAVDPMEFLKAPTQHNETDKEIHCMNAEQSRLFLKGCSGQRLGNMFRLLLSTGIREGEALALSPTDVIDDYSVARIRRTITDGESGRPEVGVKTKTRSGRRNIPLPKIARDAILDEVSKRRSEGRESHDILFSTSKGTFHQRQNVMSRHFRPVLKACGLPTGITIHDLRHTYATLALNAGVGVHLVSKMLGHASVNITIDLYSHALPDATAEAANIVNDVLTNGISRAQSAG